MKKYLLIIFLMVLLTAGNNPVSAVEDSHSGHTSQQSVEKQNNAPVNPAEHQQHQAGSNNSQPAQGHTPDKTADSNDGQANSHDGQKEVSNTGAHDGGGGHGEKEVKEVNIKPWVSAFMIYIIAVIVVALMMKKGKDNKNELVS